VVIRARIEPRGLELEVDVDDLGRLLGRQDHRALGRASLRA
jgi:hypothetical protein